MALSFSWVWGTEMVAKSVLWSNNIHSLRTSSAPLIGLELSGPQGIIQPSHFWLQLSCACLALAWWCLSSRFHSCVTCHETSSRVLFHFSQRKTLQPRVPTVKKEEVWISDPVVVVAAVPPPFSIEYIVFFKKIRDFISSIEMVQLNPHFFSFNLL